MSKKEQSLFRELQGSAALIDQAGRTEKGKPVGHELCEPRAPKKRACAQD